MESHQLSLRDLACSNLMHSRFEVSLTAIEGYISSFDMVSIVGAKAKGGVSIEAC